MIKKKKGKKKKTKRIIDSTRSRVVLGFILIVNRFDLLFLVLSCLSLFLFVLSIDLDSPGKRFDRDMGHVGRSIVRRYAKDSNDVRILLCIAQVDLLSRTRNGMRLLRRGPVVVAFV